MKTLAAISLSMLVLFQSAGLCVSDFFMLKDLIEHVEFHSKEYGDDFFTFYDKHYGSLKAEHKEQDSKEQHESLPFQHTSSHQLLIEGVLSCNEIHINKTTFVSTTKPNLSYENNYYFLKSTSIFQPPKHA